MLCVGPGEKVEQAGSVVARPSTLGRVVNLKVGLSGTLGFCVGPSEKSFTSWWLGQLRRMMK